MKNAMQPGTQTEQTIESEQQEKVIPDEEINAPNSPARGGTSVSKRKIFKGIWTFFLQNLTEVGTFLIGIAAVLAVIFKVSLPNTLQVEGTITTGENVGKFVQAEEPGESSEAKEFLQKVVENSKASVVDRAIVEAYKLQLAEEIEEAIEKWRSIANVITGIDNNLAAGAWFSVGYLRLEERRLEALKKRVSKESREEVSEESEEAKYENAIAAFSKALELNPNYVDAYYGRGTAKIFLSQYEEAMTDFSKVLELNPNYVDAYYGRGAAKFSLSQYESAIADYDKTILLNPKSAGAYANRGEVKINIEQYEEAITDCDEAIRIDRDYAYAYYIRADAKFFLGRIEEGKSDFKTALKLAEEIDDEKLKSKVELRVFINNLRQHHLKKDGTLQRNSD